MIAAEIKALSAIGNRAHQYRLMRPKIIPWIRLGQLAVDIAGDGNQIEYRRCKIPDLPSLLARHITRHGQRLEINLRSHDGRPEAQHHAALEFLHVTREDQ